MLNILMPERRKNPPSKLQAMESLDTDLAAIRGDFGEHLRGRGYTEATVEAYQGFLTHAAHWLHGSGKSLSSIFREEVWDLLTQHLSGQSLPTMINYRKALFHWLKFQGRLRSRACPPPWWSFVEEYVQYLRVHRGVGASALERGEREARLFMAWRFHQHAPNWKQVRVKDIWTYARQRVRGKTPRSANVCLSELRSFLRYVHLCGECAPGPVAAVPHVATHGQGHRCTTLSEGQRRKLFHAFERARPVGRRDYAMMLCMLDLGLRATEVARLQLNDIDWTAGRMIVPKTKSDRGRELPISRHVLAALRQYSRQGRPRGGSTRVFLRHGRRSGQPLTRGLIKQTLQSAYRRCGFPRTWSGTHRLRHTFATRLYDEHVEPKTVSDLLGHRHLDTTNIYLHLGPNALRSIVQPWPIRC